MTVDLIDQDIDRYRAFRSQFPIDTEMWHRVGHIVDALRKLRLKCFLESNCTQNGTKTQNETNNLFEV